MEENKDLEQRILDAIFEPVSWDYRTTFSAATKTVIRVSLCVLLVLALPPVVDYFAGCYVNSREEIVSMATLRLWDTWLQFISLVLDVLLVVFIGGSIFAEWIAEGSKEKLSEAMGSADESVTESLKNAREKIETSLANLHEAKANVTSITSIGQMWKCHTEVRTLIDYFIQVLPKRYSNFLVVKFGMAFPGGLYGVSAFVVFWFAITAKVATFYVGAVSSFM